MLSSAWSRIRYQHIALNEIFSFYLRPSSSKNTPVRLSVYPSICPTVTLFWQCFCHRIILKFSGDITNDRCDVRARGQGQGSKVKVTEIMTPLNRFRTITPVWIQIWQWNDAKSLISFRRGVLLFFSKVIRQILRSHGTKNRQFWPKFGVSRL